MSHSWDQHVRGLKEAPIAPALAPFYEEGRRFASQLIASAPKGKREEEAERLIKMVAPWDGPGAPTTAVDRGIRDVAGGYLFSVLDEEDRQAAHEAAVQRGDYDVEGDYDYDRYDHEAPVVAVRVAFEASLAPDQVQRIVEEAVHRVYPDVEHPEHLKALRSTYDIERGCVDVEFPHMPLEGLCFIDERSQNLERTLAEVRDGLPGPTRPVATGELLRAVPPAVGRVLEERHDRGR